jgi:dihydropteroate synthase
VKLEIKDFKIDLTNKTILMGILNLSVDSPIKKSIVSLENALDRAYTLKNDGAQIIDVGAHSTSSRARNLSTEEELRRVLPIVTQLIDEGFLVSLDSWNPTVVEEAAKSGLGLLNDVSGLKNQKMVEVVKKYDITTCIMHMRGDPKHHYEVNQQYSNITSEIKNWFTKRIETLSNQGIGLDKLIIDPGFEFGKSMDDNLILLSNLRLFLDFEVPLLVSASNKAFISEAIGLGRVQEGEGLSEATLAVQALSSYFGAHILRVHDVKRVLYVIKLVNKLKKVVLDKKDEF